MRATPGTTPVDLTGQVAVVTGGGRGLGRVFALALGRAGADVAVLARSADQVAQTADTIHQAGGRALALAADVTDGRAVAEAVDRVRRELGPVDLLVNNAGVWGPLGPAWEADEADWWRTFEVNVRGSFLCAHAVLPGMTARGRGRVVNIVSHAGVYRWPQSSAYATSKAALVKLTENLASETRRRGVAVFSLHPGVVTTGLTDEALAMDAPPGSPAAWIQQEVAAGRTVPPALPARVLVYLASGRADALSGRYLTAHDDVAAMVRRAPEIQRDDLYTLRLREPQEPAAPSAGT
jgi:NAD(P)-dependent dehydrogenase (short-subunit alcohol dehydrogenase family)